jgi:hypothetical protein
MFQSKHVSQTVNDRERQAQGEVDIHRNQRDKGFMSNPRGGMEIWLFQGIIVRSIGRPLSIVSVVLLMLTGCEEEPGDLRYRTALATVNTLFEAYGVQNLTEDEVQERMQVRGRFHLSDPAGFRGCFVDYQGDQDESLAGYVFGRLAAAKDSLRFEPGEERVLVRTGEREGRQDPVVLLPREGEWKISLRESVPASVRTQLHGIFMRTKQRALREGHPD